MCRDIFRKIAERQVEGLMFHSDMADYYAFLNLKLFKEFHDNQYIEESQNLRKTKDYFIEKNHQTLILGTLTLPKAITPTDWEDKTSADVDAKSAQTLLKKSLETYYQWESDTCDFYKKQGDLLFEWGYYDDYCFVRDLIDDVEHEKNHITSLMVDLAAVDFDYTKIKGLKYKM